VVTYELSDVAWSRYQDRRWVAFIPDCVSGWNDMAGYESRAGIGASDRRSHALEHIVAKHEVVKESRGRMGHDQGCERPCANFM
jgi:hypothetical protein